MYAELHSRTNFTFLTGASHAKELVSKAAELGLSALAITDRNGVYALPKAYHESRKYPALHLITGTDLVLDDAPPLTLLAQTRAGYGRLCRILTEAHRRGPDTPAGLSSAELWALLRHQETYQTGGDQILALLSEPLSSRQWPEIESFYDNVRKHMGDRAYLLVPRYLDGQDRRRTDLALEVSERWKLPILASNDVYYHDPPRKALQDILTCTRHLTSLEKAGTLLLPNGERYLKPFAEMQKLYKDHPEWLERTREVAARCDFSLSELRYYYPSEWIPQGYTAQSYLRHLTMEGARKRYNGLVPGDVLAQIEHELQMIERLKFADYFLTIWEIVDFARARGILCQGRGSAANSAICYCLGITAVDPVRLNLLFERFLSAERGEPPDIDVDFEHERREEVIQHIYEKYGRDRAGMVCSIITYRTRSALRDVGRAFGIEMEAKEYRLNKQSQDEKHTQPKPDFSRFRQYVEEIKGFPRHLSIHTGGFTISKDPLIETVPIQPARMPGRTVIQWDKEDLEIVGLVKVDVLALGMLTAIQKTLKLVNLDLYQIPHDDRATYQMIGRCETIGVFQIESRAQMSMLGRLQPRHFYDLVIEVAIVRPGPIMGKMVHPYLKRRRGLEPVVFPHPKLKTILGKTLGIPIFQEQVMKMAIELAGFTPGEADELRRSINAWRSVGDIEKVGRRLIDGLLKSGLPQDFVDRIFEQIKGFAHYGFPESHAASFALLTYASSYLKCHHPLEFTCSLINSQPMGFYAVHTLVEEARRQGVRVLPVDITRSDWDCTIEGSPHSLRLGLRLTRGMSEGEALGLMKARAQHPFRSLRDFLARTRIRSHILHRLAMGNAFAAFGFEPRQALWEILAQQLLLQSQTQDQMTLFAFSDSQQDQVGSITERISPNSHQTLLAHEAISPSQSEDKANFKSLQTHEQIEQEFGVFHLSAKGHPVQALRDRGFRLPKLTTQKVRAKSPGSISEVGGLIIVRQRPPTASGTVFATLEDEFGLLDMIIHKNVYEKYHEVFDAHSFMIVKGRLQKDGNSTSFIVQSIKGIFQEETDSPLNPRSHDYH